MSSTRESSPLRSHGLPGYAQHLFGWRIEATRLPTLSNIAIRSCCSTRPDPLAKKRASSELLSVLGSWTGADESHGVPATTAIPTVAVMVPLESEPQVDDVVAVPEPTMATRVASAPVAVARPWFGQWLRQVSE